MRSVLLLATALALLGCATPQGPQTAETDAQRRDRPCTQEYGSTDFDRCVVKHIIKNYQPGGRRSIDTTQVDVERYKDVLAHSLKDPTSVQFRDVYVAQRSVAGQPALCGEVNGKNSYGGYVGFQRFVVARTTSGEMTSLIVGSDDTSLEDAYNFNEWRSLCDQG
jgi:hypothetical protein